MSILNEIIREVNNPYASIAEDGLIVGDTGGWVNTGSYALNALLSGSIYGGLPSNKITEWAGEEATGKTFFGLGIIKHFLIENPESVVIIFESENAYTKKMLEERGLDTSRILVLPVATVQEFKNQALRLVDTYLEHEKKDQKPLLMFLDSLGMLSTTKEMEDSAAGKDTRDMTRSQIIKATFRTLTLKLGRANIPLMYTNHVYQVIGAYMPTKTSGGGSGGKYAASSSIMLSKGAARGKDVGGGTTDMDLKGALITCTTAKGRITREKLKVKVLLTFDKGLDKYFGLLDIAEAAGIAKKDGKRMSIGTHEKVWKKDILLEPEKYFTDDILDQIDDWTKQNFTYGNVTKDEVDEVIENGDI